MQELTRSIPSPASVRCFMGIGLFLASAPDLPAQVGLTSNLTSVSLTAHVAAHAAIQSISTAQELPGGAEYREIAVAVRCSGNTEYRLVVIGGLVHAGRIWVRSAKGEFREITAGSSVTVGRGSSRSGGLEQEVRYRVEPRETTAGLELPVRYEIVLDSPM